MDNQKEERQRKFDKHYLEMAAIWAKNSYCKRRQVGALLVKDKMIISDGFNGTPAGFENQCEDENDVTKPYVLHAEANAITKAKILITRVETIAKAEVRKKERQKDQSLKADI